MNARTSEFYRWLLNRARASGRDVGELVQLPDGMEVQLRAALLLWAGIALSDGLSAEQTAGLAQCLGASPGEVSAAYLPEMRGAALAETLDHPDLAGLDQGPGDGLR
jgi:hypothetical protein